MIPNYWYAIIESKKVKQKPVGIRRMAEDLVLWRDADGNVSRSKNYFLSSDRWLERAKKNKLYLFYFKNIIGSRVGDAERVLKDTATHIL